MINCDYCSKRTDAETPVKMLEPLLARRYEELANRFAHQGESRQRDQCLVLAADAALTADQPEEAERLRKRLLLTNPHHMLRPYSSMAEAMQAKDVRDFVVDLRKQWPPDLLEKLANHPAQAEASSPYALEPPPERAARPMARKANIVTPEELITPGAYWLAILWFAIGVSLAGAFLMAAVGWPFIE
jgi:hypothetical protein